MQRHRESKAPMADESRRDLCRRLKDKYVDKFGYAKKIVIDDCLTQFIEAHDCMPTANDLKELDIIVKKRVMGKDVKYQPATENSLKSKSLYSSQPNLMGSRAKANGGDKVTGGVVGKSKQDKVVEQKAPEVTGKITGLPAPKLKRKQVKVADDGAAENSQKSVIDEEMLNSIIKGEAPDPHNSKKKLNRWGLIDMYKNEQYQAELKNKNEKKKENAENYKKLLDLQMIQLNQLKQMEKIETKAGRLIMRGENYSKEPVDGKALFSEYDSLQKEMERSNVLHEREMQIHRLQNQYTWATGAEIGKSALSQQERKEKVEKYKNVLDKQLQDKTDDKAFNKKEKEYYKGLYKKAEDELNTKSKENAITKKKEHESYARLLDEQLAIKRKIEQLDMNDAEFNYNKDLITKASSAYQKH